MTTPECGPLPGILWFAGVRLIAVPPAEVVALPASGVLYKPPLFTVTLFPVATGFRGVLCRRGGSVTDEGVEGCRDGVEGCGSRPALWRGVERRLCTSGMENTSWWTHWGFKQLADILQMSFCWMKILYNGSNFNKVYSWGAIDYKWSLVLGNCLAPNRRQAITWSNSDHFLIVICVTRPQWVNLRACWHVSSRRTERWFDIRRSCPRGVSSKTETLKNVEFLSMT